MSIEGAISTSEVGIAPEAGETDRSWSWLAIITFVLSLGSPLAAVHWVFWPIVFVILAFALLSIGVLAYGGRSLRGGALACIALFLTLFSLAFGITRFAIEQQTMQSEAQKAAEIWFDLIKQGKLEEAHQMTMGSEYRESPEIPLKEAYRLSAELTRGRDTFFQQPPIKYLLSDPENTNVRCTGFGARQRDEKAESIQVKFSIRYRDQEIPRETTFTMGVARYYEPRFEDHRWVMYGVSQVNTK